MVTVLRLASVCSLALLLAGCGLFDRRDALDGAWWAEGEDGFPVFCIRDGRCFQPSPEDKRYFIERWHKAEN